jgi:flagellar hook-associated protein 2
MVTSLGGMSSGMDTNSLINSLMQLESRSQTTLKTKVSSYTTNNSAYQTVNTKMKTLLTAAQDMSKPDTWKAAKATSDSTDVVATAASGAQTGDMTFSVTKLASAHRVTAAFASKSAVAADSGSFDITVGTAPPKTTNVPLDGDQNTPQGVADAINKLDLSVRASVIATDAGPVLQLASTKSGAANAFEVTGLNVTPTVMSAGSDAELTIGTSTTDPVTKEVTTAGGFKVTSPSNTFTDVMPGVTITASKLATNVTVGVNSDTDALATKMQALVDAANGALAQISTASASGGATSSGSKSTGGPLAGDYTVRQLSGQILSSVSSGHELFGSFKKLGVQLSQGGKLEFNKNDFLKAYAENPANVEKAVSTGLAKTLEKVADGATDSISGSLTQKIQSGNTMISRLNKEILDWDAKLADRRTALQRQFTAMETALGRISSQSSWLSSQTAAASSSD